MIDASRLASPRDPRARHERKTRRSRSVEDRGLDCELCGIPRKSAQRAARMPALAVTPKSKRGEAIGNETKEGERKKTTGAKKTIGSENEKTVKMRGGRGDKYL